MSAYGQLSHTEPAVAQSSRPLVIVGGVGLAGSLGALWGSFLAWGSVESSAWGTKDVMGMDADGTLTLAAAVAAAVFLALGILTRREVLAAVAAVPAVAGGALAVRSATDTESLARIYVEEELGRTGEEVDTFLATIESHSAATGVWVVAAGFAVALLTALISGLLAYRKARLRSRNQ